MQGTKIVDASHDQDTTDLHKCVVYISDFFDLQISNVSLCLFKLDSAAISHFLTGVYCIKPMY